MKFSKTFLLLAFALTHGFFAGAQSDGIPGDTDYSSFSSFITQRNIFDPSRYPHEPRTHVHRSTHVRSNSAPQFTLVGTMSYQKGIFAFFSGNSSELKQILAVGGSVAGYSVTQVTATGATLQGPDKKEFEMKIGDQMQQQNNGWQLVAQGDASAGSGGAPVSALENSSAPAATPDSSTAPAPSATVNNNDVLKRLMQKREQENK